MSTSLNAALAAPFIRVRGARVHNLQNVDIDIPRGKLVVITGVSGSGKSSLAFDTLFSEGQRRYLETLSAQTRAYLDQMQRPDVDEIEGLPPVLSIEQRVSAAHPRSTLATTTGIQDFLRLLFARAGTPHCPSCSRKLSQQSTQAIVDGILSLEAGRKVMIVAPLLRGKKGMHRELFEKICREGFVRARVDGAIIDASSPPELKKSKPHDIDVIIDRIVVKDGLRARLHESVELALHHGSGACIVSHEENAHWRDRLFSTRFACPDCELSFPEIEPRTFSFNSPYGACPACQGLGMIRNEITTTPHDTVGKPTATSGELSECVCPECRGARLGPVGRAVTLAGVPIQDFLALTVTEAERFAPWTDLSRLAPPARLVAARIIPEIQRRLQYLCKVDVGYLSLDRPTQTLSGGEFQRARIAGCLGAGLIGVCYILDEPTIGLHPRDTERLLETLRELRDQGNSLVVVEHDLEVMALADNLIDLGPGAGREGGCVVAQGTPAQIMRDEHSVTGRFLRSRFEAARPSINEIATSQPIGNFKKSTLPVGAEPLLPQASSPESQQNQRQRRLVDLSRSVLVEHAVNHNLKNLSVPFPLEVITCVTGVSGSGKSTLVMETLIPRMRAALAARPWGDTAPRIPALADGAATKAAVRSADNLPGAELIDRLVEIDRSPLGRNARSNPATASGMWDAIRRVFARTRDARIRGFRASRFSFNAAGGRCDECRGVGIRRLVMQFLPDIDVVCPVCRGTRFNRQTLQVKFRGKSVADILAMRIDEAAGFFENFAELSATLQTFADVGLSYLTLGQSAATLSGGEAQRIKLAAELSQSHSGRTLYVLDEPTTGLHPADIERLVDLLERLADAGNTVIVIEHQLDVIVRADWVIDLGPEGGAAGGQLVAAGTPDQIAQFATSHTGQALRKMMQFNRQ